MGVWLLCLVTASVDVRSASAQDVPPASGAPVVMADAPTDAVRPSAEELYDQAFTALASGDRALAARHLQQLTLDYPDHALVAKVRPLLDALATAPTTVPPPPPAAPAEVRPSSVVPLDEQPSTGSRGPHVERTTTTARAELIFSQTLHGIAVGAELCVIGDCQDGRAWVGALMLGGGLGFGGGYFASADGITPGMARIVSNGMLWGAEHALILNLATGGFDGFDSDIRVATSLLVGQLLGIGVGGLFYSTFHPTAGQVSLTSSGGIWAYVITGELLGIIQPPVSDGRALGWLLLAASDAGLLGGGLLAAHRPMSASRVLMIDASGILGTLTGLGLAVLAQGDNVQPEAVFTFGLVGTLGGLGTSYYLTETWDDDSHDRAAASPHLALAPTRDGATMMLSGQW